MAGHATNLICKSPSALRNERNKACFGQRSALFREVVAYYLNAKSGGRNAGRLAEHGAPVAVLVAVPRSAASSPADVKRQLAFLIKPSVHVSSAIGALRTSLSFLLRIGYRECPRASSWVRLRSSGCSYHAGTRPSAASIQACTTRESQCRTRPNADGLGNLPEFTHRDSVRSLMPSSAATSGARMRSLCFPFIIHGP